MCVGVCVHVRVYNIKDICKSAKGRFNYTKRHRWLSVQYDNVRAYTLTTIGVPIYLIIIIINKDGGVNEIISSSAEYTCVCVYILWLSTRYTKYNNNIIWSRNYCHETKINFTAWSPIKLSAALDVSQ